MLTPQERYSLTNQRAKAISSFIRGPHWQRARSQRVSTNSNRFKDIVAPFMSPGVDRGVAARDLNIICDRALKVSATLNSTDLSFQFIFNECGTKVSEQSHRALNSAMPPRELQGRHWRLMCVVTPRSHLPQRRGHRC